MNEDVMLRLIELGFQYMSARLSYDDVKVKIEPLIKTMKAEGKTDDEIIDLLASRAQSAIDAI